MSIPADCCGQFNYTHVLSLSQIYTLAHGTIELHTHTHIYSVTHWAVQLQGGFALSLPTIDVISSVAVHTNALQMASQMYTCKYREQKQFYNVK